MNRLLLFISVLFLLSPLNSLAASQLPRTGQTNTFSAGDDGDIRAGKPWSAPRFSDNRNGTVNDNLTGLVWSTDADMLGSRSVSGQSSSGNGGIAWQDALNYVAKLNAENYLGFTDWRLPNLVELASLVNLGESSSASWLVAEGFMNVASASYWSSTTSLAKTDAAWSVAIASGTVSYRDKSATGVIWPVRGIGSAIVLPWTGQTTCYTADGTQISCAGTGQDGELRMGIPWPEPRLVQNNDNTVNDNLSGLVWGRAPGNGCSPLTLTWVESLDYVAELNRQSYLDFSDWRLPNRLELASLISYAEASPPALLHGLGNSDPLGSYWSSSTVATSPASAWCISSDGIIAERNKIDPVNVESFWLVRNGELPLLQTALNQPVQLAPEVQVSDSIQTAVKPLSIDILGLAGVSGTVTAQETGLPVAETTVTLEISGVTSRDTNDRQFVCNDINLANTDYPKIAQNDADKYLCAGYSTTATMLFKVRNPYGRDPFTVKWNGVGTLFTMTAPEYLAQSFRPTRSGLLTKASIYIPFDVSTYMNGNLKLLLKTSLGGDRGSYLALSDMVVIYNTPLTGGSWIDFTFPAPVMVTAGQQYYLEINGTFFEVFFGNQNRLYSLLLGATADTGKGMVWERSRGLWQQGMNTLALRTYLDGAPDIADSPISTGIAMQGATVSQTYSDIYRPALGTWAGGFQLNRNIFPDSDGYDYFNGDDLSGEIAVSSGLNDYYDSQGWLQVRVVNWDTTWNTALLTDLFSLTFNRTYSTITDVNGAYSFADVLDGNYRLTFDHPAYISKSASGALSPGQNLIVDSTLVRTPSPFLKGTLRSAATGTPVAAATITIHDRDGSHAGTTDTSGSFLVGGLSAGPFTVGCAATGFATSLVSGNLAEYQTTDLSDIFLATSTATSPQLTLSAESVSFGRVQSGATLVQTLTVGNNGSSDLHVGAILRSASPFWIAADNCSNNSIPSGGSCQLQLQFSPVSSGYYSGSIAIPSSDPGRPVASIPLSGESQTGYRIPHTGQSSCYASSGAPISCSSTSGQDGNVLTNPLTYTDMGQTVKDNNTGLVWEKTPPAVLMTWQEASDYCLNLTLDNSSDWRLPTFLELITIVNYGRSNPTISTEFFTGTTADDYWSTTEDLYYGDIKTVSFYYGTSDVSSRDNSAYGRCVHGQVLSGNFISEAPYTTTDLATGLVWTSDRLPMGTNWAQTAASGGTFSYAEYSDWRLPNIKELATYPDSYCYESCSSWSSTTANRQNSSGNYILAFSSDGNISTSPKSYSLSSRFVRGGNPPLLDPQTIRATPAALDFDWLTGSGASLELTIANSGGGSLSIGTIAQMVSPFAIVSDLCSGQTLTGLAACTVTVSFTPVSGGTFSATLAVPSNDADRPLLDVPLIGSALRENASVSGRITDSVTGVPIAGATVTLTDARNTIHTATTGSDGTFSFTSPATGNFSGVISKEGYSTVSFGGLVNYGQQFRIDRSLVSLVALIPDIAVTPAALDFGTFDVGTNPSRSLAVSNSGSGNLVIGTIAAPAAPFVLTADNCSGQTLAEGTFCSVTVRLDAAAAGDFFADIAIPSNASSTPLVNVHMTGTALLVSAPQIGNPTVSDIGSNSAIISWSTAQPATGSVQYGITSGYGYSTPATLLGTSHQVTLSGLNPATVYHFRAVATATGGSSGFSTDGSFITQASAQTGKLPADNYLSLQEAYNHAAHNDIVMGLSRTYAEDLNINRPITVTLQGGYTNTAYASRSGATVVNGALSIADGTVTIDNLTITGSDPNNSLTINNVAATGTTISWTTNLLANSRIEYGPTESYGSSIAEPGQKTGHSITLTGLMPGITYHYKVSSSTPTGISTESADYTFTAPPALEAGITSPAENAALPGPDVTVSGTFLNPTGATTTVTVNGLPATINGNSFVMDHLPLQPGINTIFVTVTDINGLTAAAQRNVTASSGYTLAAVPGMTVGILSPAEGATVTGPDSAVKGVIFNAKGDETGVIVNGVLTAATGSTFVANHVPLSEGSNTINVTATDVTGQTATATRSVTAQTGHYIRIVPNIESGTAPLDVILKIDGSFTREESFLSYTGPASIAPVETANPEDYGYRITTEGAYEFTAEVLGPDGHMYTDTVTITVLNQSEIDRLLRTKWNEVNGYLSSGNTTKALSCFTSFAREKYSAVFNEIGPMLPDILATFTEFRTIEIGADVARYKLITLESEESYAYDIVFEKEENGLWLLRSY